MANCLLNIVKSKVEDVIDSARDSSNGDSGSFWCSAVNRSLLNFIQLMMIDRLCGALAVAGASWHRKLIHRFPLALRSIVIVCSIVSIGTRTADLFLGFDLSRNAGKFMSSLDRSAFDNATVPLFACTLILPLPCDANFQTFTPRPPRLE